ncbi:MAG: serine--tRNA ligase [Myxococcota bacterium]|nr:serine--tRNA ligase [Myxococcota bacterium]
MLDPRLLREKRDEIVDCCRHRNVQADVDLTIATQDEATGLRTELNEANRLRNEHQKSGKRPMDEAERKAHVDAGRAMKEGVSRLENDLREVEQRLDDLLMTLPNFIHPETPLGGEDNFCVVKEGQPTKFDFEPLDHLALCEKHELVDFETAAKVTGQKFYYLKNEAALLDLALQRFALDRVIEKGFTPFATPDLARPGILTAIGFNPRGQESQIYSVEDHDLCLVGTAEITLGGMLVDSIVDEKELPIRVAGISHCFRTEAGAHGRESRGLYRVHQFSKAEMFVFCRPEDSEAELDRLCKIEESIFDALEIPYRVIDIASGDLGAPAYRKFDLEAWMPGRGEGGSWGEVTSASNCTDFQARRLKTRYRPADGGKPEVVHTLNGTAISNARAILALIENHQRADGSIRIPSALVPYLGRESIGLSRAPAGG